MIRILRNLSAFFIGINLAQAKVLATLFLNRQDDDSYFSNDGLINFPSDEEIDKYGRLAVEQSLEEIP